MTPTNRRNLFLGSAAVVAGMSVGGMSSCPPSTSVTTLLPGVIDAIQKAVATVCGFVPDVASLLAILAMFPGIGGVASIAQPLLTEVSSFLCAAFHAQGGAAAAVAKKPMTAKLKDGAAVTIHGLVFDPATGKFVEF
jgi:hypothetical protein